MIPIGGKCSSFFILHSSFFIPELLIAKRGVSHTPELLIAKRGVSHTSELLIAKRGVSHTSELLNS
jgi:hypothetical protein